VDLAEVLIEKGAEVDAKDREGKTPLHIAAEQVDRDFAEFLLKNGADINAEDNDGNTPIYYARQNQLKSFFEDHGGN